MLLRVCYCRLALLFEVDWLLVCAARRLYFTMRGGSNRYGIVVTPMVAITVSFSTSVEEFYGDNVIYNIALLLSVSV